MSAAAAEPEPDQVTADSLSKERDVGRELLLQPPAHGRRDRFALTPAACQATVAHLAREASCPALAHQPGREAAQRAADGALSQPAGEAAAQLVAGVVDLECRRPVAGVDLEEAQDAGERARGVGGEIVE